jgi:hypothetical protein
MLPLPPGYDRLIPARSPAGLEREIQRASHVWFAATAGAHLLQLTPEAREKMDQVVLVDPDSQYMKILADIQKYRGKDFPEDVRRAVRLCKSKETTQRRNGREIGVRLSSAPLLNVAIFDPGTEHAWARVQEFIPYFLGQQSMVYAVRKKDWKELYDTIELSFVQTWGNGRDPKGIYTDCE